MRIERWDPGTDGPLTEANLRRRLEARGYAVRRYVYPPGTVFEEHHHAEDKIDAVASSRFRVTLQGRSVVLGAGDAVHVPRGAPHRAEVVGSEPVVSLDAVRIGRG
jgi:quercetin dioxygenase-like cupin family protein